MDLSSPGADWICGLLRWRPGLLSAKGCFCADCGYKAGDLGAEVFFLSATANGLLFQGMPQQAIDYAERAVAIAKTNSELGYPDIAYDVLANSLLSVGKIAEAKQLSTDAFRMARHPVTKGEAFFLAYRIAEAERKNSQAISLLESGIRLIRAYGETRVLLGWESDLSKLYMMQGNLFQAEDLARRSVSSIEGRPATVIPEYLDRLNNLAQILIKRGKFWRRMAFIGVPA
jgi:tetratricopeptide (TPR) repeat protein